MNPQSLERIRKRKADDDEEMMFFIFPALYMYLIDSDGESQHERELEEEVSIDDELQILDQVLTSQKKDAEDEQASRTSGVGGAKEKLKKIPKKPKRSPKKSSGDALVGVMQRFVDIIEKESKKEDAVDFSITRCMTELRALEGVTTDVKVRSCDIFKCAKNRETFINAVADKDGSALAWLQNEIDVSTTDAVDFSITRCMTELRALEGVTTDVKVRSCDIFKCAKNREIFINAVADKAGSALAWLQNQIGGGH